MGLAMSEILLKIGIEVVAAIVVALVVKLARRLFAA
jgi:hypothetical protein